MDARRVAIAVVVGGALTAVVLSVGVQGLLAPLLTTDGYHPPNSTAAGAGDADNDTGSGGGIGNATTSPTSTPVNSDYAHATVIVEDENGTELGRVRAAVAESYRQQYTGLSETEYLPPDRGMLFPYEEASNHTFVMRRMSFGIDIVYVDADGTITEIHHAEEPPEGADGNDYEYPGYGQYVLEVNHDWTTERGIEVGDQVRFEGLNGSG